MTYVISDIHGCWREYQQALEKIGFSETDRLYILGDLIDRGPDADKVLRDVMARKNVRVLAGNHEFMALPTLSRLTRQGLKTQVSSLTKDDIDAYTFWASQGGNRTLSQLASHGTEEIQRAVAFLSELPMYEEVSVGGRDYLLVHAGLEPFLPSKPLQDYSPEELLFHRADYSRPYFADRYTITGHTPTFFTDRKQAGFILHRNHHIAIDCGCVYGYQLGVYCLETGEEFYVKSCGQDF